jgi:hypothetical protein
MNALQTLFKTSRLNLSKVGEQFINPCCIGEDLAAWLRIKLIDKGNVRGCGFKALVTHGALNQTPDASATVAKCDRNVSPWLQRKVSRIMRVDAGVGNMTIATTPSQTIDGVMTYLLTNQWQFVNDVSDGANGLIVEQN